MRRILIANRGEIACRIARTVQALGFHCIAVYSDADADARHVRVADDAVRIGPAPATGSYLDIAALVDAAQRTGADAVHPGYGFLAENADFARACSEAGLIFIGPSPDAIDVMGNKALAKRRMIDAGVPCVPGYQGDDQDDAAFVRAANDIGYPVMIKASAGGGGRGMRLVGAAEELPAALARARSEAGNAFGSDALILEKALVRPRHVEVQVFADSHGNVIHLGERDCSMQRRHQKVIEEAPCPVVTPALRDAMGASAVEAARSIDYRGAGTVEFLLDDDGNYYFLEMNTRLQVEHPVTECITGLDLVGWQLRVAAGEPLPLAQDDVRLAGHAIEARLYAEDPARDFLPGTGTIGVWHAAAGDGVRVDSGVQSGQTVSPYYDPLLAKIIAWGDTRETARRRLVAALRDTAAFGVVTNRSFLVDALEAAAFVEGAVTTAFIDDHSPNVVADAGDLAAATAIAAVMLYRQEVAQAHARSLLVASSLLHWSSSGTLATRYELVVNGERASVLVKPVAGSSADTYATESGEHSLSLTVADSDANGAVVKSDGRHCRVLFAATEAGGIDLCVDGRDWVFSRYGVQAAGIAEANDGLVHAPMHGVLQAVSVAPGDTVAEGAALCVLEAMKMQHEIVAPRAGRVVAIEHAVGDQVAADALLITIEDEPDERPG